MKKIIYSALIMLVIIHGINGMEKEGTEYSASEESLSSKPKAEESLEPISCKNNKWVLAERFYIPIDNRPNLKTIEPLMKNYNNPQKMEVSPKENEPPKNPRDLIHETIESSKNTSMSLQVNDIKYVKTTNSLLISEKSFKKHVLEKELSSEKNINKIAEITFSFDFKYPYFFKGQPDNKNFFVSKTLITGPSYRIKHNTRILNFGVIEETVFSGSNWPSIKKSTVPTLGHIAKTEPFIDNAFLLACQDNGMVIAKINQENNAKFWFWRRFNTTKDVQVTLYGLFFAKKSIQNITTKMVETALDQAKEQYSLENKNFTKKNTYSTDNITVITLATNVVLTAEQQANPTKFFPKAATSNNTALVVHTKRYNPDDKTDAFPIENPAVSIAYKETESDWKRIRFFLEDWIKKQKQIANDYIRLPDLYEIKDIYITEHNKEPVALLISKVNDAKYADGVYVIPLTGQKKYDLPEPLWHVDIVYNKKTESWLPIEKMVASTFDYDNKRLFLITESIPKQPTLQGKKHLQYTENIASLKQPVNQQLITIDITEAMNDPQRLKKIDESKLKTHK